MNQGQFLSKLSESKLSNHLGFNGFVELADGNIVFVKREMSYLWLKECGSKALVLSKNKYCLNDKYELTKEGISKAICLEISYELKLDLSDEKDNFENTIFAFYRDLVEGGKPQFLFYYKTENYNKEQFIENFERVMSSKEQKRQNRKKQIIDGKKFAFFTIDKLKQCEFSENYMLTPNGVKYRMMPSSIASIIMLINNIEK